MLTPPKMTVGKTINRMPADRRDSGPIIYLLIDGFMWLSHADVWDRYLLEEVRRCYGARRICLQRLAEFRLAESPAEVFDRLPDCIVNEHTASADASVQLRRDKARLLL